MSIVLPNMRLLKLPSESLGEDSLERQNQLDQKASELGFDLADESLYLLFDRSPAAILAGEGSVRIARSVIGPKKSVEGPFELADWVSGQVHQKIILAQKWDEVLGASHEYWELLHRENRSVASHFMTRLSRKFSPEPGPSELVLGIEAFFPIVSART